MQKLKVHENGQFFMYEDGTPFFYLADTAWDIFQRLTRDEVEYYMSVRSKQGFTAVQSILLSGTEYYEHKNKYGRTSLKYPYDKLEPDTEGENSWWDNVDFVLDCAEKYGLYMVLVPMWNAKYSDPETTLFKGYEPSFEYGKFIGERFRDRTNIIWLLGGDVEVKPHMEDIFRGVADGIKAGEAEDNHHLIGFHPRGISNSVAELGGDRDYLDFHTSQSGHTVESYNPYKYFGDMPKCGKPFLDAEAHYEDHVANWVASFRRWDGNDIREGAYESVFAGACGQTYGNPIMCFFLYEPITRYKCKYYIGNVEKDNLNGDGWMHAIRHPGAETLQHLKKLRLSRPYFDFRPAQEMVLNSEDDFLFGRISAARGKDYAFVYTPYGREIKVDCSQLDAQFIRASWFNPRTGEERLICQIPPRKAIFVPETQGKGQDWVLILDGGKRNWKEIGQIIHE